MLPGSGKFERTGLGSDWDAKEASNTAFSYLKANGNEEIMANDLEILASNLV